MIRTLSFAATLALSAGALCAAPSIVILPAGYLITDLSVGGAAGAGNVQGDGSYETFRWTADGTIVRLGLATVPVIGIGAGTPDISYDGQRVSASILSSDMSMTWGLWDIDTGWQESMPPPPPGSVMLDNSYGSAWGLSGDGATVTGFHWGVVGTATRARASKWSSGTGMITLPQSDNRSARVNGANYDGSVVVGWEERADGVWRPTAWRGMTKHTLQDSEAFCEAGAVNADGSVIVGSAYDAPAFQRSAARWVWNGASYDMTILGVLPMTQPNFGEAFLNSVSDDGLLAVGFNRYLQSPGGPRDGLVWTPQGGLMKATDYVAGLGLLSEIPAGFAIVDMVSVSPDGGALTGIMYSAAANEHRSFVIYLNIEIDCPGDANGDNVVDFADFSLVLGNYGLSGPSVPGDLDGDGTVDFTDFSVVLSNYGTVCE